MPRSTARSAAQSSRSTRAPGDSSFPAGQVEISWRIDGDRLIFEWVETGGPPVTEPTRKSFGTRMMASLGQQLKGQVALDYESSGFVYTLNVPLETLTTRPKSNA